MEHGEHGGKRRTCAWRCGLGLDCTGSYCAYPEFWCLYPKNIEKPLQVFQTDGVWVLNWKSSLLPMVFLKLVNSRYWKEYMRWGRRKNID